MKLIAGKQNVLYFKLKVGYADGANKPKRVKRVKRAKAAQVFNPALNITILKKAA
jgi:hypothetical protein